MPPFAGGAFRRPPEDARAAIERFLESSREPELIEAGEPPIPVQDGRCLLESRAGSLILHAWSDRTTLARRITGVHSEKPGRLELIVERFGKKTGRLSLVDRAHPSSAAVERRGERHLLREQLRRSLARQFPDWTIAEISSEPNLEASLSPVYPRALLRKGRAGLAAMGCPAGVSDSAGALSFGLVWLDYLRRRERGLMVQGLVLFIPQGLEKTTCARLRYLHAAETRFSVYVCSQEGYEQAVDPRDYGNLDTRLEPCTRPSGMDAQLEEWIERLRRPPHVERILLNDGSVSLRVRGLEFARAAAARLWFGLQNRRAAAASNLPEIERLAEELAQLRAARAADRENPIFRLQPERWMESQVRSHVQELDASLLPEPLYGQVPAMAGAERGLIDLLAVDTYGRLAVIELKASEDIHLPVQALDYWMRVAWHAERGDFSRHGYFPGIALSDEPPRLLLVAPALEFHPTTEAILRFFSHRIEVERIGLGVEWRERLKVMFRIRGAERPR